MSVIIQHFPEITLPAGILCYPCLDKPRAPPGAKDTDALRYSATLALSEYDAAVVGMNLMRMQPDIYWGSLFREINSSTLKADSRITKDWRWTRASSVHRPLCMYGEESLSPHMLVSGDWVRFVVRPFLYKADHLWQRKGVGLELLRVYAGKES